jgi:3-oxoacyl-[acyl-carrier protein] reductase
LDTFNNWTLLSTSRFDEFSDSLVAYEAGFVIAAIASLLRPADRPVAPVGTEHDLACPSLLGRGHSRNACQPAASLLYAFACAPHRQNAAPISAFPLIQEACPVNVYDLNERVAVVTGGAQGIGLAVANRILASGGCVAIWDRDRALLDETVKRIAEGDRVQGLAVDIADLAAVENATKATIGHFGRIDILVNNAAIVGPNAPTWEYPPEAFRDVVNVGLLGTFYCCRAVVPHMIAANYGRIVNLSSVAGKEGNPKAPAYSATKAAVIALTKSLGKELAAYNIGVNCVTPAVAKTALAMSQAPDFLAMIVAKIPRGRMLELEEAASMICWLASAENSFTTGAAFDLSGGRATY